MPEDKDNTRDESSLDKQDTVSNEKNDDNSLDSTLNKNTSTEISSKERFVPKKGLGQRVQVVTDKVNIYLLLFIFIVSLAAIAGFATYINSKDTESVIIDGQELSQDDLNSLQTGDHQVGDPQQTLTIAANSVFNGRVLVRDNLDVAGTIRVGGELSLPGITVSGTSSFEDVQVANNLAISGNAAIQGTLTVQRNLSVGGSASFAGQISAPSLSVGQLILNGDLQINRHIDAGGPTPLSSRGGAVGGAGTVSISGTDTAGTVSVNFGGGSSPGTIANITFTNPFSQTPHVVITPVGSSCAGLNYYVNRTTGGFSIGTTTPGSGSCAFDYIAID